MVFNEQLHGFESLEEQSLLLALDFTGIAGGPPAAVHAPVRIPGGEFREHVPDFLAVASDRSRWLFDVRPARLVKEDDATYLARQRRRQH